MKRKEGILIILILVLLVGIISVFIIKNNKNKQMEEYIPEEEISDEQIRETIITLYFKNKENEQIEVEARKADVGELIKDPYNYLINELINGPKNEKLEKIIPEGVRINKTEIQNNVLIIDFSKEFIENAPEGENEQKLILKSIVNTLTELTEVNYVKILIDGNEEKGFKNSNVTFNENMERTI